VPEGSPTRSARTTGRRCSPGAGWTAAGALGAVSIVLAGCGSPAPNAIFTVDTARPAGAMTALVSAFERQTGIRVKVRSGDENDLAAHVAREDPSVRGDVVLAEDSPALQYLQERGLLAPVAAATISRVPSGDESPEGDWVGISARVSVLVYNTSLVTPGKLPTSVLELATDRWRGHVGLAPNDGDFPSIVTAVGARDGNSAAMSWLEGLKVNADGHLYADDATLVAAVNRGQVAVGLVDDDSWYQLRAKLGSGAIHSELAYFAPSDPGYLVDVSGAAVLASSRHRADADRFVAYLVSPAAQEVLAQGTGFEYPLGSGVPAAMSLRPLDQLEPDPITVAGLGDGAHASMLLSLAGLH